MHPTQLAEIIAKAAAGKKARDIITINLAGKTTITDYFVICEGDTDRQIKAIVDNILEICRQKGVRPIRVDATKDPAWACLDFDTVIVHVFLPGERTYYDLEGLWEAVESRREQEIN